MLATPLLLVAVLCSGAPSDAPPSGADPSVSLSATLGQRQARLLPGVELAATFKPSQTPPLRLTDDVRLGLQDTPEPLDTGGGVSAQTRQILALVLGLVIGFGLGHLVARDQEGFVLFLLVDIAIITVMIVLGEAVADAFFALGAIGLVVSHVIQGLDAYHSAGGPRIIQWWRERAVRVASSAGDTHEAPAVTTRVLRLTF